MTVIAVYDLLANDPVLNSFGIDGSRIDEMQSIDTRPKHDGMFIVLSWEETTLYSQTYAGLYNGIDRAPRVLKVSVHESWHNTRDYDPIDKVLKQVDKLFDQVELLAGSDGVTVTSIRKAGRSRNMLDEGWETITRNAVYGVLYHDSL